jgi:hypothetical protein
MHVRLAALALLILLPSIACAATFRAEQSLDLSSTPDGNAYLAGADLRIDAPVTGDLFAAAGKLSVESPVKGDINAAAWSADFATSTTGALRVAAGSAHLRGDIGGELVALGGSLDITGRPNDVHAAGGTVTLQNGAHGAVVVYGVTVSLAGDFAGDVRVVASDRVTLAPGTHIHGTFEYNAPSEAVIPTSASIDGGSRYIGSSSFLPSPEEAKTFALAGIGIFFAVRLVAAMLTAGLVAGLFPALAAQVAEETLGGSPRKSILLALLGFGVIVATPVATVLLLASFVGIGLAALVGAAYLLFLLLGYVYAAVIAGAAIMRVVFKRRDVPWKGAVLGMIALSLIGLIPAAGFFVSFLLSCAALGALARIFYKFAFGSGE